MGLRGLEHRKLLGNIRGPSNNYFDTSVGEFFCQTNLNPCMSFCVCESTIIGLEVCSIRIVGCA